MIRHMFVFGVVLPTLITVLVFVGFLVCWFKFNFRERVFKSRFYKKHFDKGAALTVPERAAVIQKASDHETSRGRWSESGGPSANSDSRRLGSGRHSGDTSDNRVQLLSTDQEDAASVCSMDDLQSELRAAHCRMHDQQQRQQQRVFTASRHAHAVPSPRRHPETPHQPENSDTRHTTPSEEALGHDANYRDLHSQGWTTTREDVGPPTGPGVYQGQTWLKGHTSSLGPQPWSLAGGHWLGGHDPGPDNNYGHFVMPAAVRLEEDACVGHTTHGGHVDQRYLRHEDATDDTRRLTATEAYRSSHAAVTTTSPGKASVSPSTHESSPWSTTTHDDKTHHPMFIAADDYPRHITADVSSDGYWSTADDRNVHGQYRYGDAGLHDCNKNISRGHHFPFSHEHNTPFLTGM